MLRQETNCIHGISFPDIYKDRQIGSFSNSAIPGTPNLTCMLESAGALHKSVANFFANLKTLKSK